jgi:pyruvate,water dikinase
VEIIAQKKIPLAQMFEELLEKMFYEVFRYTVPLTFFARHLLSKMTTVAQNDPLTGKLELALEHNVTTEMGLSLAEISKLLPEGATAEQIKQRLDARDLPAEFLEAWDEFIRTNGFRGPEEIDVGSPRYSDDPTLLINLLISTKKGGEDARETFEARGRERRRAYDALHQKISARDPKLAVQFARDFAFFEMFGGYRETHKKYLVYIVGIMRAKIVEIGKELVLEDRLDRVEQVFDLSIDQIDASRVDERMDLRKLAQENTVFLKKLARVQNPPTLIDSRGFIPRPPKPPLKKDEVAGEGVSVGVVRGKIKVLQRPDEKPLLKGEILVARATDPGWTPLFVNAGGIILEIGGSLQHGALVAREYGIPCVTGIEHATTLWRDGMLVEVDGSLGIIRTL